MKYRGYKEISNEFSIKLNDNIRSCKSRSNKVLDFLAEDEIPETIKVYFDVLMGGSMIEDFIINYVPVQRTPIVGETKYMIGSYTLDNITVELHIDMLKLITDRKYHITNENGKTTAFDITIEESEILM